MMWYLGGKKRQAPQIVAAVRAQSKWYWDIYVEPFCGAMWSAMAVMRAFPGRRYLLNDRNPYLMVFWRKAVAGWDPPAVVTEETYRWYNARRPVNDPMTGYVGFAWSFGGKFFGGAARTDGHIKGSYSSTMRKLEILRHANGRGALSLSIGDFSGVDVPDGAMVYLDPPYEGRTPQTNGRTRLSFDSDGYYRWAEELAGRCTVLATEFLNPRGWPVLHDYGDTVVRHHAALPPDGTRELLLRVTKSRSVVHV